MDEKERITLPPPGTVMKCPYDPKHAILSQNYFSHINNCCKRAGAAKYSFQRSYSELSPFATAPDLSIENCRLIMSKVQPFVQRNQQLLRLFDQPPFATTLRIQTPFPEQKKNGPQLNAIVQQILPLLSADQTIIEAGSGTGMLSCYLAWYLRDQTLDFKLIEREQGFQHKFDRYIRQAGMNAERYVLDLRAIDYTAMRQALRSRQLVVGKHLCGHATDCVLSWHAQKYAIALCCHSKADGSQMVGKSYLHDCGLTDMQIFAMFRMTAWRFSWIGRPEAADHEKEEAGALFRKVIDMCRILWLQSEGYSVQLLKYCDEQISPECYLLIASKE